MRSPSNGNDNGVQTIQPLGPNALLLTCKPAAAAALATEIRRALPTTLTHSGDGSLVVRFSEAIDRKSVFAFLQNLEVSTGPARSREVILRVRYDGPDLASVAESVGLSVGEVIERHSRATYESQFCGFAPGFSYLTGLDRILELPRLASPRTTVPAGSVAIAAHYCAVYPSSSPGGWHLLGTCDVPMFDATADVPATLPPGTRVRFEPIR